MILVVVLSVCFSLSLIIVSTLLFNFLPSGRIYCWDINRNLIWSWILKDIFFGFILYIILLFTTLLFKLRFKFMLKYSKIGWFWYSLWAIFDMLENLFFPHIQLKSQFWQTKIKHNFEPCHWILIQYCLFTTKFIIICAWLISYDSPVPPLSLLGEQQRAVASGLLLPPGRKPNHLVPTAKDSAGAVSSWCRIHAASFGGDVGISEHNAITRWGHHQRYSHFQGGQCYLHRVDRDDYPHGGVP